MNEVNTEFSNHDLGTYVVRISLLDSHPGCQRPLNENKVAKMEETGGGYNPGLAERIPVNLVGRPEDLVLVNGVVTGIRNTRTHLYVMDHQHQKKLAERCGVTEVDCRLFENLAVADMKQFFVQRSRGSKSASHRQNWGVLRTADDTVDQVETILATYGLSVDTGQRGENQDGSVRATLALETVYRLGGPERFETIVGLIAKANKTVPLKGYLFYGLELFLRVYEDDPNYREKVLVRVLIDTPEWVYSEHGLTRGGGSGGKCAKFLVERYNHTTQKRLDISLLPRKGQRVA